MRKVFNKVLVECAEKDPRIHLVLADIGYGEIEPFARRFPDRYVNKWSPAIIPFLEALQERIDQSKKHNP